MRTTYGSSETAGGCVYDRAPLPGVRLRVLDPDPTGAGRLEISSPTLATGYLTAEGGTDASPFTAGSAPVEGSSRAFLTSDLAQLGEDGALSILGRADDVINTGGRKVLPQDVERAIERSLMLRGMVRASVVVGVADPEWGQRSKRWSPSSPASTPRTRAPWCARRCAPPRCPPT